MNEQLPPTITMVNYQPHNGVVSLFSDDYNSRVTLANRIEHILNRTGWSARKLSLNAGLSASHVGTILTKARLDPDYSLETKTLRALASAAGVSSQWLLNGEGDESALDLHIDEPSREDGIDDRPTQKGAPSTFGGFADYDTIEATAKIIAPEVPEWAWSATRTSHPLWIGKDPPSASVIADIARVIMRHKVR